MLEHGTDNGDVKRTERFRQTIDVAVVNFGFRIQESVAKPVGVFPLLDFRAVLRGPALRIAEVGFVFEGQDVCCAPSRWSNERTREAPFFSASKLRKPVAVPT